MVKNMLFILNDFIMCVIIDIVSILINNIEIESKSLARLSFLPTLSFYASKHCVCQFRTFFLCLRGQ